MEMLEYLDLMENKLKGSFNIKRNYSVNNCMYDMFAEYHIRNEKYVLLKKAVVYSFENNEYCLFKYCENLNRNTVQEIISNLINSVELIIQPGKDHMSSIITLIFVTDSILNEDLNEITKTISSFSYNKGFAFGFKGWADIRAVLVSLKEGLITTNKKGKEVIEVYKF